MNSTIYTINMYRQAFDNFLYSRFFLLLLVFSVFPFFLVDLLLGLILVFSLLLFLFFLLLNKLLLLVFLRCLSVIDEKCWIVLEKLRSCL
jgi:hypothetical protein